MHSIHKNNKLIVYAFVVLTVFSCFTQAKIVWAESLRLYFSASQEKISVGDTVLIKLYLDTNTEKINVLDGTIHIVGDAKIEGINTGGSAFSLWPSAPTVENNNIIFTGGAPSSVKGQKIFVFSIAVTPRKVGKIEFEPISFQGYLDDGKGTLADGIFSKSLTMIVNQASESPINELQMENNQDTVAPEPFTIDSGRDQSLYDGQLFVSFVAHDDASGISHYEVKEGDMPPVIVKDGIYVLREQTFSGLLIVTAYDNAGNSRVESISFAKKTKQPSIDLIIIGVALVLGLFGYIVSFFYKRNLKSKK